MALPFFLATHGGNLIPRVNLLQAFLDRYYPASTPPSMPQPLAGAGSLARFAGEYRYNDYSHRDIAKLDMAGPFTSFEIKVKGDRLVFVTPLGTTEYVQVAPLVFQQADGGASTLGFRQDPSGNITAMSTQLASVPMTFERLAWYESQPILLGTLFAPTVVFLLSLVASPSRH